MAARNGPHTGRFVFDARSFLPTNPVGMWRMTLLEMEWLAGVITFLTEESELLLVLIILFSLFFSFSCSLCRSERLVYIYKKNMHERELCGSGTRERMVYTSL